MKKIIPLTTELAIRESARRIFLQRLLNELKIIHESKLPGSDLKIIEEITDVTTNVGSAIQGLPTGIGDELVTTVA